MARYNFKCKVCEKVREFDISIKDVPKVGVSQSIEDSIAPDQDLICSCGTNNWTRVWGAKTAAFKINMRGISI